MFKKGQKVLKIFHGKDNYAESSVETVASVKKGVVSLLDSVLTYSLEGKELDPQFTQIGIYTTIHPTSE